MSRRKPEPRWLHWQRQKRRIARIQKSNYGNRYIKTMRTTAVMLKMYPPKVIVKIIS